MGLRYVLAAVALLIAAPSSPAAQINAVPLDQVARDHFPTADHELVDGLSYVNRAVNHLIQPVSDLEHYGVSDKWVSMPDDMKGDCEDYASTKLVILGDSGFPIISHAKLVFVTVRESGRKPEGHAIVEVRLNDGSVAILDNRFDNLMRRQDLERHHGYTFYDW